MPDESLDRATAAISDLADSVRRFTIEVERDEALRTRKIRAIQHVLWVLAPCVALLIILAVSNFSLLSRVQHAADDSRATNELLASCFDPNSVCGQASNRQTEATLNKIRQTQFVIAICQRQNTADKDPTGNGVIKCVQSYYPNFTLPPQQTTK